MAIVTTPLLLGQATGTLAGILTFQAFPGQTRVRANTHRKASNPKTRIKANTATSIQASNLYTMKRTNQHRAGYTNTDRDELLLAHDIEPTYWAKVYAHAFRGLKNQRIYQNINTYLAFSEQTKQLWDHTANRLRPPLTLSDNELFPYKQGLVLYCHTVALFHLGIAPPPSTTPPHYEP